MNDPYPNARAVESAIKDAAKRAHQQDDRRQIGELIRQAHYDRFLCRVFADGADSAWVLKGGTGMLARVPNTRSTLDADLFNAIDDLDQALTGLRRAAQHDLGDHYRFSYREHHSILDDGIQPYISGYRVVFDAYLGAKLVATIKIDLSSGPAKYPNLTATAPANRLDLPRLITHPYRLYPVPNQVADKVCATITEYRGRPSSREKDIVDLVIIARTQELEAQALHGALGSEARKRALRLPDHFEIPARWGRSYSRMVKGTPADGVSIDNAKSLMGRFLDPILTGSAAGTWSPQESSWSAASKRDPLTAP